MVPKSDQKKIKGLLKETITLLCKNGLAFKDSVSVEALIGVTVDEKDVFLVSLNEIVEAGNEPKSKRRPSDESDEEESSKSELNRKGKQKRKRGSRSSSGEESADEMPEVKHKKTPVEIRTPKAVVTPKEVVTPKQVKTPTRTATPNQAKVPAKSVKTPQIQPEGHPKPLTQPQPQTELNMSCEMVDQDGNVDLSAVTVKEEVLEDWAVMLEKESSTVSSAADNDIPIPSTSAVEDPSVSQLGEMDHSADEMCEEPSTSEGPVTTHSQSSPSKVSVHVGQSMSMQKVNLFAGTEPEIPVVEHNNLDQNRWSELRTFMKGVSQLKAAERTIAPPEEKIPARSRKRNMTLGLRLDLPHGMEKYQQIKSTQHGKAVVQFEIDQSFDYSSFHKICREVLFPKGTNPHLGRIEDYITAVVNTKNIHVCEGIDNFTVYKYVRGLPNRGILRFHLLCTPMEKGYVLPTSSDSVKSLEDINLPSYCDEDFSEDSNDVNNVPSTAEADTD